MSTLSCPNRISDSITQRFPNQVQIDERRYMLITPFFVVTEKYKIYVDQGFKHDGLSVPRFLWWFQSPFTGRATAAGVIHDVMYATHALSRGESDSLFKEVMKIYGVPLYKRIPMWAAVRAFGWIAWVRKSAESAEDARDMLCIEDV